MAERSPIFRGKGEGRQIGYLESDEAFDLLGKQRCYYNAETGNLRDINSEEIVGHVSLDGKVVGVSWIIDELFSNSGGDIDQEFLQNEVHPKDVHAESSNSEMPSAPPSEQGEAMALVNAARVRHGLFSEETERVFKLLRDRIGLSGTGSPND